MSAILIYICYNVLEKKEKFKERNNIHERKNYFYTKK